MSPLRTTPLMLSSFVVVVAFFGVDLATAFCAPVVRVVGVHLQKTTTDVRTLHMGFFNDEERKSLTRDSEPEEYFQTYVGVAVVEWGLSIAARLNWVWFLWRCVACRQGPKHPDHNPGRIDERPPFVRCFTFSYLFHPPPSLFCIIIETLIKCRTRKRFQLPSWDWLESLLLSFWD